MITNIEISKIGVWDYWIALQIAYRLARLFTKFSFFILFWIMKKKIEMTFCDYCNKTETEFLSENKCKVCEKDICFSCFTKNNHSTTDHMGGVVTPIICKHCWEHTNKIDWFFNLKWWSKDYRWSWNWNAIKMWAYVRTIYDKLNNEVKNTVLDMFYSEMKAIVAKNWWEKKKQKLLEEAEKEFREKTEKIKLTEF